MTITKTAAAGALVVALAGTIAIAAHASGAYVCQTWNLAKSGHAVTHCVTWAREAAASMRAAGCDPRKMTDAEMRARCTELMAEAQRNAQRPAG